MSRASRNGEQGGARIKSLIVLILLGAFVFCCIKIIPSYLANYELQDSMRQMAAYASAYRKQDSDIRSDVEKKVKELGIPADSKDIQVVAH
ncbi:MAG: hypothetical protein ACYC92_14755, partial [Candidatus Acidiferrales bacterium]